VPPATRSRLADFATRLAQRRRVLAASGLADRLPLGQGTVALFTGPAGTGKTFAAVLIAKTGNGARLGRTAST
jgi:DNA replication protein DnaC